MNMIKEQAWESALLVLNGTEDFGEGKMEIHTELECERAGDLKSTNPFGDYVYALILTKEKRKCKICNKIVRLVKMIWLKLQRKRSFEEIIE